MSLIEVNTFQSFKPFNTFGVKKLRSCDAD